MNVALSKVISCGLVLVAMSIFFATSFIPVKAHQQQENWINQNRPIMSTWVKEINNNTEAIKKLRDEIYIIKRQEDERDLRKRFKEDVNEINESKIISIINSLTVMRTDLDYLQKYINQRSVLENQQNPVYETKVLDLSQKVSDLVQAIAMMNIDIESLKISIELLQKYNEIRRGR